MMIIYVESLAAAELRGTIKREVTIRGVIVPLIAIPEIVPTSCNSAIFTFSVKFTVFPVGIITVLLDDGTSSVITI